MAKFDILFKEYVQINEAHKTEKGTAQQTDQTDSQYASIANKPRTSALVIRPSLLLIIRRYKEYLLLLLRGPPLVGIVYRYRHKSRNIRILISAILPSRKYQQV